MAAYVRAIRARIDERKSYPALARRRAEEGLVRARLVINESGGLEGVELSGDRSLPLRRATQEAVEAAAPFMPPPAGGVVIEVSLRWRVTH